MRFKKLIKLIEQKIFFQYPGEDKELARDKIYPFQQFENWFKNHKFDLIWNEQAHGLDLSIIPTQFNIIKGNFNCSENQLESLKGCPEKN